MGLKEVTLCCCAVGLMGMGTFFTSVNAKLKTTNIAK